MPLRPLSLMPAASVRAYAPRFATMDQLIRLKKIWSVSLAAVTYRLHKLGLLSDWHYRKLYIEISKRGYRKAEPHGAQREASQVLHKVFSVLRVDGVTKHAIAEDLKIHPQDINELVFGLALTALEGAANVGSRPRASRGRAFHSSRLKSEAHIQCTLAHLRPRPLNVG